jgi:integrase/recombinase XerD
MTPLRKRMLEDMRLRNLSVRTQKTYIEQVAKFAKYFNKSPEELGPEEIRTYLVHLVEERKVSWSLHNQTVCALRFLYRVTLGKDWTIEHIPHPKKEKRLPVVLSLEEISQLFEAIKSIQYRALLMTAYAAGLRLSEVVHLKVSDIDSKRMVIHIRQGKGRKDRYVMLGERLLQLLREYWKQSLSFVSLCQPRARQLSISFQSTSYSISIAPTRVLVQQILSEVLANILQLCSLPAWLLARPRIESFMLCARRYKLISDFF